MSDFKSYADWAAWRDKRNADKARGGFVQWVKGPFPPKDHSRFRNRAGGWSGMRLEAGSKLSRKAAEGRVGARTVGVVSIALENIARSKRAA